jgi:hypothetical protein
MNRISSGGRWRRLLVYGRELATIAALGLAITLWEVPSRGMAALGAAPFGLALAYLCILAGRLFIGVFRLPPERFGDIPTVVLVGFLTLSSLLLVAALALPLFLPVAALLVALGVVGGVVGINPPVSRLSSSTQGLACLVLSLAAGTLWSLETIKPTVTTRSAVVIFRPWVDGYNHACFIRIFRDAQGIFSLEHFSMAGERAPFYHYGSLLIPALLSSTTETTCYLAYASFYVPLGMTLTGLAAFAMARWWWGPGAGLAATVGVLMLPDASWYGLGNRFLSYFWLEEIAPTSAYGIALLAVAWILVFEGCRAGRPGLIAAGFVAAGLNVAFKAQLFFASALLVWVYPAFFFRGFSSRIRLAWLVFSVATFAVVIHFAQRSPEIPLMKLDGSGLKPYVTQVISNLDNPRMKQLLAVEPTTTWTHDLLAGVVHLTFGTFGIFMVAFPIMAVLLIRSVGSSGRLSKVESALFPILVTANYLVMALGLALDDRTHHMPNELLHRPLVWAYFVVAAWTVGCFHEIILKPRLAPGGPLRRIIPVVLAALLCVPYFFGQGVQVGPMWSQELASLRVPGDLVHCAGFLREHSARGEVVQYSMDDRWNVLSALAERPIYVADTWRSETQTNPRILHRLDEMAKFRRLIDPAEIGAFAAQRKIVWYVLDPSTRVNWPGEILAHPAFQSGDYRVYHFAPKQ